MDFEATAHRLFNLFYLIGLSAYNSRDGTTPLVTWKMRLFQYFPMFSYLTLSVTMCIVCEQKQIRFQNFPESMDTI